MKIKSSFLLLVLILVLTPHALGNKLTKNSKEMVNYTILFINNRTASQYKTITDDYGNFVLNQNSLTDDASKQDVISAYIGKSLDGGCYQDRVLEDKSVSYKCDLKNIEYQGHFRALENISSLSINILTEIGKKTNSFGKGNLFSWKTIDEQGIEFCSIAVTNLNQREKLSYYDEKFLYNKVKTCEFKIFMLPILSENVLKTGGKEIISFSEFSSDGETTTLILMSFEARVDIVDITNPYDESVKALIKTTDKNYSFENGKKETVEILDSYETKTIPLFSSNDVPYDKSKTEINFIKIDNINVDSNININFIVTITVITTLSVGLTLFGGWKVFIHLKKKK